VAGGGRAADTDRSGGTPGPVADPMAGGTAGPGPDTGRGEIEPGELVPVAEEASVPGLGLGVGAPRPAEGGKARSGAGPVPEVGRAPPVLTPRPVEGGTACCAKAARGGTPGIGRGRTSGCAPVGRTTFGSRGDEAPPPRGDAGSLVDSVGATTLDG